MLTSSRRSRASTRACHISRLWMFGWCWRGLRGRWRLSSSLSSSAISACSWRVLWTVIATRTGWALCYNGRFFVWFKLVTLLLSPVLFIDGLPFSWGSWIADRAYSLNNVWGTYTDDRILYVSTIL